MATTAGKTCGGDGTSSLLDEIEEARRAQGVLSVLDLMASRKDGVVVLDPFSTIISASVKIRPGTTLYPGTTILCDAASTCTIGSHNVFWPQSFVSVGEGATVTMGDHGSYGPGGAEVKADGTSATTTIGSHVRLANGVEVIGPADIGDGCQILGPISAQSVILGGGESYRHPNPDARGAVLKGAGRARSTRLGRSEVINGVGDFAKFPVERQLSYHPRPD